MAELGIAASIIQIAGLGVKLTKTLYEFGSNAASACEQTDFIARNVTQYTQVLELLGERLDDDQSIHSKKALNLAEELYKQSYDLFDLVKSLLPYRGRYKDQLSFLQKIAWNFKKSKVELLVAEVEYLKTTVQVLVQVLYSGRKIRSYKRDPAKTDAKREAVRLQYIRAENAMMERQQAYERLPDLEAAVQREDTSFEVIEI